MTRFSLSKKTPLFLICTTAMITVSTSCASEVTTTSTTTSVATTSTTGISEVSTTTSPSQTGTTTSISEVSTTTSPTGAITTSTQSPPKANVIEPLFALSVLEQIVQANEFSSGYSRDFFRHWTDADRDSCNTREEVLILESLSNAQVDRFGCAVVAGDWFSAFDGVSHTDPSNLDIDHLVPLKEAWDSGAHSWSAEQREEFANDLSDGRSLIAVTNSVNRSKGDRDPSQWLPPRSAYVCQYISDWIAVKWQWKLTMDQSEWGRVKNLLTGQCRDTPIALWGSVK